MTASSATELEIPAASRPPAKTSTTPHSLSTADRRVEPDDDNEGDRGDARRDDQSSWPTYFHSILPGGLLVPS